MNITIIGKDLKATEAIKDYVEEKLARVEKYFGDKEIDIVVTIRIEKSMQIAEIIVKSDIGKYIAVNESKDLYASIDKDIDIIEGQIRKAKSKREKMQKDASIKQIEYGNSEDIIEDEVVKILYYDVKPTTIEDAKLKLSEKQGNLFLTFVNVETGKVNVIFKLKDSNNYGIVEPEN